MSVDFEPVRIGGRRRRIDPLLLVAGAVVIALGIAVLKPWESSGGAVAPSPLAGVPTPTTSAEPSPSPRATRSSVAAASPAAASDALLAPTWPDLFDVTYPHGAWGALIVSGIASFSVFGSPPIVYEEAWSAAEPAANPDETATLLPGSNPVAALGLTFPAGQAPDDVRIWQLRPDDQYEWIDTRIVAGPSPEDPMVFVRPVGDPVLAAPWDRAVYRFDILRDGRIERLLVALADSNHEVRPPAVRPATESRLVPPSASDPSGVRFGLFATVDGFGVPIGARASRPLDEAGAWRSSLDVPDNGRPPTVAAAFLPRATGLGVMLTPHASLESAALRRLAPSTLISVPRLAGGLSNMQGATPYVVVAAPDGGVVPPGVYAITVTWSDDAGPHAETWHVELRPGPVVVAGNG